MISFFSSYVHHPLARLCLEISAVRSHPEFANKASRIEKVTWEFTHTHTHRYFREGLKEELLSDRPLCWPIADTWTSGKGLCFKFSSNISYERDLQAVPTERPDELPRQQHTRASNHRWVWQSRKMLFFLVVFATYSVLLGEHRSFSIVGQDPKSTQYHKVFLLNSFKRFNLERKQA